MTPDERKILIAEIAEVMRSASPQLSEDEQQWVRMAIQKEAQTLEFRKAIIEKTLGGLIWSAIVGFGYIMLDFLKNHGLRL
jgi:transposase